MTEESKRPDGDMEAGLVQPSTTASSMTSQRHPLVDKTEAETSNGHPIAASTQQRAGKKKARLITYDELPDWYQDNPYIIGSYRPESSSTTACFASLTYLHNETFNIYSHMIPAIVFLLGQAVVLRLLHQRFPDAKPLDYIVFSFFLLCAFVTMSSSFLYHTLMNHSRDVSFLWLRLDYVGILALTLGDFVSGIRVGFYCNPTLQKIYWSMVGGFTVSRNPPAILSPPILTTPQTLTLGALTSLLVIHPKYFQSPTHRRLRIMAFGALALSGLIPIAHGLIIYGWDHMWAGSGMPYYLLEGAILMLGAFFYASRCPESVRPGRFDVWGCSHNIFHVLVVVAAAVHLLGIWRALEWHLRDGGCSWSRV